MHNRRINRSTVHRATGPNRSVYSRLIAFHIFDHPVTRIIRLIDIEDLGVGDSRVVIDSVVEEPVAACARGPGSNGTIPTGAGSPVLDRPTTMGTPPATVGDPALFLDVDMDQASGSLGFVTDWGRLTHRQACHLIDVSQQRHLVPVEDAADSRAWNVKVVADPCGPHRRLIRSDRMRLSRLAGNRVGLWWGRLERSSRPSPARCRRTHLDTVAGETWKRSATRRWDHPSSMTRATRRRLPSIVSGALRCVMKTSGTRS